MFLDPAAADAVSARVAGLEAASGVEVVTAVIARADSYPEVPWKAFALGASLAALAATVIALFEPGWEAFEAVLETAVAVLAAGGALALASAWITPFARILIPAERREAEVRQYAQALFLEHELHRTRHRDGILILVSLLEHRVVVLADRGVSEKVARSELDSVIATVTGALSRASLADALLAGLDGLDGILARHGIRAQAGDTNEFPDTVIQQRGPA
ncbi:MAG: TPM domain-containing protein [Betaproteobacteria bacterium]|nr:TPM domain-containing protein [Betaproteobacteria bacterium]MDH3435696.1 TPM domain-containing protein [Betaproteobacteria bacterium]